MVVNLGASELFEFLFCLRGVVVHEAETNYYYCWVDYLFGVLFLDAAVIEGVVVFFELVRKLF